MSAFESHSQAGQDEFIKNLFVDWYKGTFMDVGCSHPININNTYALEKLGWTGILIDNDDVSELCKKHRTSPFVKIDATKADYTTLKGLVTVNNIDYLSLDVDAATTSALSRILDSGLWFHSITVEHDSYRFGDGPRNIIRRMLENEGYTLLVKDVKHNGLSFEDWWVDFECEFFNNEYLEKFIE